MENQTQTDTKLKLSGPTQIVVLIIVVVWIMFFAMGEAFPEEQKQTSLPPPEWSLVFPKRELKTYPQKDIYGKPLEDSTWYLKNNISGKFFGKVPFVSYEGARMEIDQLLLTEKKQGDVSFSKEKTSIATSAVNPIEYEAETLRLENGVIVFQGIDSFRIPEIEIRSLESMISETGK